MRSAVLLASLALTMVAAAPSPSGASQGSPQVAVLGEAAASCGLDTVALRDDLAAFVDALDSGARAGALVAEVRVVRHNSICVAAVASARGATGALAPVAFHARPAALGGPVADALRRQAQWLLSREAISLTPTRLATSTSWSGKCDVRRDDLVAAVERAGALARDGWGVMVVSTAVRPSTSPPLDGMPTGPEYCASLVQVWRGTARDADLVVTATNHGHAARAAAVALAERLLATRTGS